MKFKIKIKYLLFLLIIFIISACSNKKTEWSESYKKFLVPLTFPDSEWSADDFGEETTTQDQLLLKKFLPRIFITHGELMPLDFYKEYLPKTVLKNSSGKIINKTISRQELKTIERKAGFYLDYQGELKKYQKPNTNHSLRVIYGRVFNQIMNPPLKYKNDFAIEFKVLKYSLVFPASGLPKILTWYKNWGLSLLGNKNNWHELDIHGAIHILVEKKSLQPKILLLAQHNYFRSYAISKDILLPKDNRIAICIAQRSNEPYPCPKENKPLKFRTVGNPDKFAFVLGDKEPWFDGGYDLVQTRNKSVEVNGYLQFLPSRDPLYVSWIDLGDKQKLLGIIPTFFRDAPPGINMNTSPKIKEYTDIAKVWYFSENDSQQILLFNKMGGFFNPNVEPLLEYNGTRLWKAIK